MKSPVGWTLRLRGFALAVPMCLISSSLYQGQAPVDSATILVSLLERPIGRETYEMHSDGQDFAFTDSLDLIERGGHLQFRATLRLGPDFTPSRFSAKGQSYRFVNVDANVEIANRLARVQNLGETARVSLPKPNNIFYINDLRALAMTLAIPPGLRSEVPLFLGFPVTLQIVSTMSPHSW